MQLVNYIWKNVNCDEIRVGIAHIPQGQGKFIQYEPLKIAFQNLGFRWKTLVNDEKGGRILVLGLNRPENVLFDNLKYYFD